MHAHILFFIYDRICLIDFCFFSRSSAAESNNNIRRNSLQQISAQSIEVLKYEAGLLEEQVCFDNLVNLEVFLFV
jgi:hypothetical protein